MKPVEIDAHCRDIVGALSQIIVGKDDVLHQLLAGILANGHILIEDYPGLAKTLIARLLSETLDLDFKRIQFTPDLLPGDITGGFLYDQREARFEFRRGPIFTQLLLVDEINRATPRTQSALLEAMQEGQVSVDGETRTVPQPFLVLATQNPIELEGTFALPEAQLDRFIVRISMGYPDHASERAIARRHRGALEPLDDVSVVLGADGVADARATVRGITVSDEVEEYVVRLVRATRDHADLRLGASPRATVALYRAAQAAA